MRLTTFLGFVFVLATVLALMAGAPALLILFLWVFFAVLGGLLLTDRRESRKRARATANPLPVTTGPRPSIARRAALAVLLTIGFYTLAFGMIAVLAGLVLLDLNSGRLHFQLLFIAGAGIFAILAGIVPQPDAFVPPWPGMTEEEHPRLFAKLKAIATKANQAMPDEVYLLPELNAWVADRGGVGGRGSRRIMGIGLPLLQLLDVSQFSAVIAHEFGHYYGGDTRLGPWIYRTRSAIGRTLERLSNSGVEGVRALVNAPFQAYGKLFLRVTHSVSRQQEYTADQFAAVLVSPQALIGALKRLEGYGPGVTEYWNRLLIPTLGSGYRPPMIGGLARLAASEHLAQKAARHTATVLAEATEDPLIDTHPCLRDRVAALEALPPTTVEDTAPALSLLDNIRNVEDDLLCMYMREETVRTLKDIDWNDVGEKVYLDYWTQLRDRNREHLASWTVTLIPELMKKAEEIVPKLIDQKGNAAAAPEQPELMFRILGAGVALALRDAGWTFVADPEHGVHFAREEKAVDIDRLLMTLVTGQVEFTGGPTSMLSAGEWEGICEQLGVAGMPLGGAAV